MSWKPRTFDELGVVSRGRSRHRPRDAAHLYGGPYPFVQTGDVKHANLYLTEYSQTYSDAGLEQSRIWPPGTVCITIAANIADTAILGIDACFPDSVIGFIPDEGKSDARFVKYLFDATLKKRYEQFTQGAAQDNLSQGKLLSLKFPIPSVTEQKQIADLLSTYDDLIENNRRRIKLLEQAARLLYKEWFVHLRFPGHDRSAGKPIGTAESHPAGVSAKDGANQHVKIKDGVPEGWEKRSIGELAPFKYGKALKKDDRIPGPYPVYGSSGIVGAHDKALVTGPAIIVGRKGNVGSVYRSKSDFYPIDTVYYIEPEHCSLYLYYALLHTQFISTDVAVPGLNRDYAHSRKLFIPDNKILTLFEQHEGIMQDQIEQLTKYNQSLTKARDLLLPRLMNGEIAA